MMKEPQIVLDWKAEGEQKGLLKGEANMLIRLLKERGVVLPEELAARIRACEDSEQLGRWAKPAATATTVEEFRRGAGL